MFRPISCTKFSIHASAKEATLSRSALPSEVSFQSTPPRRRRRLRLVSWGCEKFFNPRLREGGDELGQNALLDANVFNPRLREGGDHSMEQRSRLVLIFQSTPPRRRRQERTSHWNRLVGFQSTPPRRRRPNLPLLSLLYCFFNPRLREGGDDLYFLWYLSCILFFNPRLREGGDCTCFQIYWKTFFFNPRLREGGDF